MANKKKKQWIGIFVFMKVVTGIETYNYHYYVAKTMSWISIVRDRDPVEDYVRNTQLIYNRGQEKLQILL